MKRYSALLLLLLLLVACSSPQLDIDRETVVDEVSARAISEAVVDLGDGLSLDECGALAITRNPEFQATLATLDIEMARFVQAGLLRNPVLALLFPLGPKQLEATMMISIEALWERPHRVSVASLNVQAVADDLVQNGLGRVRDAKLAFIDVVRLRDVEKQMQANVRLLEEQLVLQEMRLEAGDAAPPVVAAARVTLQQARARAARNRADRLAARVRLNALVGGELSDTCRLIMDLGALPAGVLPARETALKAAMQSRPDLRAAEIRIERALAACDLADVQIASVQIIGDINGEGKSGFEAGPGLQLELPIFDYGQGRQAMALAELEQARAQLAAVRNQIMADVDRSLVQARAATINAQANDAALEATLDLERKIRDGREGGTHSDLDVIQTRIMVNETRLPAIEAQALAWRARVEADFALGQRLELMEVR